MSENENIMDSVERISRGVAYHNYYNFLSQYLGLEHPILSNPGRFFYVANQTLRCLGSGIEINMKDGLSKKIYNLFNEEYFPQTPLPDNIIKGLIETLYAYLSQFTLSPYEKALFHFKWQCGLRFLPYFDDLKNITIRDNKIYLLFWNEYGTFSSCLLTDSLMKKIVTENRGRYLATESAKRKLSTAILDQFGYTEQDSPDIFSVSFAEGKLTYIPSMEVTKFESGALQDPLYKPYLKLGLAPTSIPPTLSNNLRKVLNEMTGGSIEELDSISELVARMLVKSLSSKYLWHLSGIGSRNLAKLLSWLCDAKTSSCIYETKGKHLYQALILDSANHSLLQLNRNMVSQKQLYETNRSVIKKLIQGTNITQTDDPFILHKQEYLPVVAIIQSGLDFKEFFKKIPCRTITVGDFNPDFLTDEDRGWLKLYLTARGLHLIYQNQPDIDEDIIADELIFDFLSTFCIKDDTEPIASEKTGKKDTKYTKTKDLCVALKRYATVMDKSDLDILKHPTLLSKKLKSMGLVEKEHRAANNTKCFMGIEVAEEKLSAFIQKKNQESMAPNTFEYALDSMSHLIQFEDY